jgi:hypothetical protein
MAKYDIQDFDYGSMVDQISGITGSRKKPNFLKRYAPQIIETLVGVTDNYKTYQLRNKMDDANFENTLEVAKLKAEAAKQLKRHKDTKPKYDQLISKGFTFDKEQLGNNFSDNNLAVARDVYGNQAWNAISQKFKHALPQTTLNSYDDYLKVKTNFGVNEKESQAIENFYNDFVKERANYVYSGQAYDFDQFTSNLKTLEDMQIDYDVDNVGLMAKISGSFERRIDARQSEIDMFKTRYLTKPAAEMVAASQVWKDSDSVDQYSETIKNSSVGLWGALSEEQINSTINFDVDTKQKVSEGLQKIYHNKKDVSVPEIRQTFNTLVYGTAIPSSADAYLFTLESREVSRIRNNKDLTVQEQDKQIEILQLQNDTLIEDFNLGNKTNEQIDAIQNLTVQAEKYENEIKLLLAQQDNGNLKPSEKQRLNKLKSNLEIVNITRNAVGSPVPAVHAALIEEALASRKQDEIIFSGTIILAEHAGSNKQRQDSEGVPAASVAWDKTQLQKIRVSGQYPDDVIAHLATMTPEEVTTFPKTNVEADNLFLTFPSIIREQMELAKQDEAVRARLFPNGVTDEEIDDYTDQFGSNYLQDKNQTRKAAYKNGMISFFHRTNEVFRVSEENHMFGNTGYFHGKGVPVQSVKNEAMVAVFLQNQLQRSTDNKEFIIRTVDTQNLANNLHGHLKYYTPIEGGGADVDLTPEQILDAKDEALAKGDNETALNLEKSIRNKFVDITTYPDNFIISPEKVLELRESKLASRLALYNTVLANIRSAEKDMKQNKNPERTLRNKVSISTNIKILKDIAPDYDYTQHIIK